jgi:hypothetical protein
VQCAQTSWSVTAWHTEQERMPSSSVAIAVESRVASSRDPRSRWKAIRCADLGPMPGSLRSSSISFATGAG